MNLYWKDLNYCYIAYYDDKYKFVEYIADSQKELAKCLKIDSSVISRSLTGKHKVRKGFLMYEKVQIHDYCFVVYEKELNDFVFITKKLEDVSIKFNVRISSLVTILKRFFCSATILYRSDGRKYHILINGKYQLGVIDLFDLDSYQLQRITNIIEKKDNEELDF